MEKNVTDKSDHEITSQKTRSLPNTKNSPKKMNDCQNDPNNDRSKIMALQDALQDPITVFEGF